MKIYLVYVLGLVMVTGTATPAPGQEVVVDTLGVLQGAGLREPHQVDVYLPPGYAGNPSRRYPVLYANDGQDLATAHFPTVLATLVATGQMAPIIVVAIYSTDSRTPEYATAGRPALMADGVMAAAYQRFVLDSVMPLVSTRYRTRPGAGNTGIMGWSLGGLSAFDMAWNHPDRFGTVGVFSGSLWWRDSNGTPEERSAGRIVHRMVRAGPTRPALRLWFMAGRQEEEDDRDGNGVIDVIQDTRELIEILVGQGHREGGDIEWHEVDGQHNLTTWSRLLPAFLGWAFPT
ncbi:MAG: alpha/beta hydrolase [Gemmatimonadales bacterium]